MSDKPETLAAILAEMRAGIHTGRADIIDIVNERLIAYADRIEAAAERERNAHTNDIHDALYKATGIPGNAAAMREAQEQALAYCESDQKSGIAYSDNDVLVPMLRAALAAPARNCDRPECRTEEGASATYIAEHPHAVEPDASTYGSWLLAPAKGGDHA